MEAESEISNRLSQDGCMMHLRAMLRHAQPIRLMCTQSRPANTPLGGAFRLGASRWTGPRPPAARTAGDGMTSTETKGMVVGDSVTSYAHGCMDTCTSGSSNRCMS